VSSESLRQRQGLLLLLTLSFGYVIYAVDRSILSSVLSVMETELNLTKPEVGLLGSAQYLGVLGVVFLSGYFSDRFGRKKIILAGVIMFTTFTWTIAIAQNFFWAFLFRFLSGIGEGLFWPVAMAAVAETFSGRKGVSLGIFYVGFDVGSVAGLAAGAFVYTIFESWRYTFLLTPLAGIPVIIGILLSRNNLETGNKMISGARIVIKKNEIQAVMLFAFLATWASVWQVVFLPYYFYKVMHFGVLPSALLSSLVLLSGAVGKVVMGRVSDTIGREKVLLISSLLVVSSFLIFFFVSNFEVSFAGALMMGFFGSSVFPVMQALAAEYAKGAPGTSLGMTTSSQSVATVLAPAISGYLFYLGVGRALALDAIIPSALMVCVASFLLIRRIG
jgi:MFS family permease